MYIEMTYQKMSISGGGHGNSLQYSCLKNLMDRGVWWAIVHGVTRVRLDLAIKPPQNRSIIQ